VNYEWLGGLGNSFSLLAAFAAVVASVASTVEMIRFLKKSKARNDEFTLFAKSADETFCYNQTFERANLAFFFGIMFASIGFGIIIFSLLSYDSEDLPGTVVKVASGTIIAVVSGLFLFQSARAQRTVAAFFEALRLDRLNAVAWQSIAEIENAEMRDELRAQLVLKYSVIDKLLTGKRKSGA
jgi:ABC-type Fe3+-siderophore transport system permease subunit